MNKIKLTSKEKVYSITCIFLIIDQIVKLLIKSKMDLFSEIIIIPNFFSVYYVQNEGAAFSILKNQTIFLILIGIVCIFLIDKYLTKENIKDKLSRISLGILMGGIFGNLIDRILYGGVIDYLSFTIFKYNFPVFNIADIGITIGIILLIISLIIEECKNKKAHNKNH